MTGPEFAKAHSNDSSTWTAADFETYEHLAMADLQPAFLLAHPPKPAQPATRDCWFCSAPNPATATRCGFCNHHTDDNPNHQPAA